LSVDVKDLEMPTYDKPEIRSGAEKVTLKVQRFPGQTPMNVAVDPDWTVSQVEAKLADSLGANRRTVRLHLQGQPLPQNRTIRNLMPQIQERTLEVVPEHPVGVQVKTELPLSLPSSRYRYTDYRRVKTELLDLPFKPGYGRTFRVKVRSANEEDLLFPLLEVNLNGRFYPFQLVLVGYAKYPPTGYFKVIPPCPIHGRKHPHVFSDGRCCWGIETVWKQGMMLFEDYIQFLFRLLEKPQEHLGCGY